MATTGENFVKLTNAVNFNGTVQAAGSVAHYLPSAAVTGFNESALVYADRNSASDFANDANAKHGAIRLALSGTTPKTIDLTDLTSAADTYTGDTVFGTFNTLVLFNDGAADVTFAPGGSNPASVGLGGTSPTLTVKAGMKHTLSYAASGGTGVTVDSTHKTISITPTSGGSFILTVSGA